MHYYSGETRHCNELFCWGFPASGALQGTLSHDDTSIVRLKRNMMIHTGIEEICVMHLFPVGSATTRSYWSWIRLGEDGYINIYTPRVDQPLY